MKHGDIIQLGRHRLMCGDCTNAGDVGRLSEDQVVELVATSPPYLKQRKYLGRAFDFTGSMTAAFACLPATKAVQAIVNLGPVHTNGVVDDYWLEWKRNCESLGWRHHGLYVWDKKRSFPGDFGGRPFPQFEFLFHMALGKAFVRKVVPTKHFDRKRPYFRNDRSAEIVRPDVTWITSSVRAPSNIFTACTDSVHRGHPAAASQSLFIQIVEAFSNTGSTVFDPFSGCGTTMMAAEKTGRQSLSMEIEPAYCELAVARYRKHLEKVDAPSKPKRKVLA